MENSVTLTLARYHDLMDIEQKFDEQVEKALDLRKRNQKIDLYVKSSLRIGELSIIINELENDKASLTTKVKEARLLVWFNFALLLIAFIIIRFLS